MERWPQLPARPVASARLLRAVSWPKAAEWCWAIFNTNRRPPLRANSAAPPCSSAAMSPASRTSPIWSTVRSASSARSTSCSTTQASLEPSVRSRRRPAHEWQATLDVLLNGVFYGMKHAARVMQPRMKGSIISMASTAGIMGGLGPHAYCAAKHAVIGLTKNVGAELCRYGMRVNAIAPAGMATAMVANVMSGDPLAIEATKRALAQGSPLINRAGVAEDVANAALWLASDESGYTNGHTLTTDAGATTGSRAANPAFDTYRPMFREAGKSGL